MKNWITTGLLCLFLAGHSLADSPATESRQQLFNAIEEESEALEDLLDDEKWQQALPAAEEIANKVAQLSQTFPKESQGEGRSKDRVWEEWATFQAKLQGFERNFRAVARGIRAEDFEQAEDSLAQATSSCRSCHMSYRSLW